MLADRLHRKSTSKRKKIQINTWYRILGTEIMNYERFTEKLRKYQRKTNYTQQNENNQDSLSINFHITSIYQYE